jgi:hypothetical protein
MKRFFVLFLIVLLSLPSKADEGMWIPLLLDQFNIKTMQEMGFKLSAEDIYSVNQACMKDAVLSFGGGCTGEMISGQGLLITNHHCGYSQIQSHSSLENDYLTNGFWAMSNKEELPCPGLFVTYLKRMEDVSDLVLEGVTDEMNEEERSEMISKKSAEIITEAIENTHYTANVVPFYMGNQYFLFVYETYNDVRFVGAPPSAIGKFGGETDNWIWPRHTGDFSLFRVYADKDNKPAAYSPDNVPYEPLYYFPISLKGVEEGDFTMVFGYPGSTNEYVPSYHIDMVKNYVNPKLIGIRGAKIEIMEAAMAEDPLVRIQYSAKKSNVANSWKKWIGEIQGLEKMNTISKKEEFEANLAKWIEEDNNRKEEYGYILPEYKRLYDEWKDYYLVYNYTYDVFYSNGAEAVGYARNIAALANLIEDGAAEKEIADMKGRLMSSAGSFFKNYDVEVDKKLFVAVTMLYSKDIDPSWQSPEFIEFMESCKGDPSSVADKIFSTSIFTDEERFVEFVENIDKKNLKKLYKDPFYKLSVGVNNFLSNEVIVGYRRTYSSIQSLNRHYMKAQMEFQQDKLFYPDANSTLRVAFGTVKGYESEDGIYFRHYSTLKGIMEKDNPDIYDYDVPDKLRELYELKDYGNYVQDGEVPVCFIANNHTTGGNSGSPVINSEGHLIGINFDRAWEGVASDMAFNPAQSRNISLDIRYALFIIDKFAGAGYLLDEMTLVE